MKIKMLHIKIDSGTQRRQLDTAISDHYAELLKSGVEFPPVELVHDGKFFYLWDGFHRHSAHQMLDHEEIDANVQNGTLEDAIWLSYSANTTHGLPRKPGEIKQAIEEILNNPKWSCKTDKEIAEHINCSYRSIEDARRAKKTIDVVKPTECGLSVKSSPQSKPEVKGKVIDTDDVGREPAVYTDKADNVIPEDDYDLWLENQAINSYVNQLNSIKRELDNMIANKMTKIRLLNWSRFEADWQNCKDTLAEAIFYGRCPYCNGTNDKCSACKGIGFVNKRLYDAAPKDEEF
jgi:hypothetical protein